MIGNESYYPIAEGSIIHPQEGRSIETIHQNTGGMSVRDKLAHDYLRQLLLKNQYISCTVNTLIEEAYMIADEFIKYSNNGNIQTNTM